MKTEVLTALLLSLLIACSILHFLPVNVTYTMAFADRRVTLTERMTVAQRGALQDKEGFLFYGSP